MQGSEMRVGMHSPEFGNVSISTSINTLATHQTMAAQISFEHADLARMVTAHLPSIETRLSHDSGMQARIEVRDQSASADGETGRNSNSGQAREQGSASTAGSGGIDVPSDGGASNLVAGSVSASSRLDIRI
jgi:hypothetical protein